MNNSSHPPFKVIGSRHRDGRRSGQQHPGEAEQMRPSQAVFSQVLGVVQFGLEDSLVAQHDRIEGIVGLPSGGFEQRLEVPPAGILQTGREMHDLDSQPFALACRTKEANRDSIEKRPDEPERGPGCQHHQDQPPDQRHRAFQECGEGRGATGCYQRRSCEVESLEPCEEGGQFLYDGHGWEKRSGDSLANRIFKQSLYTSHSFPLIS